MYKTLCRSYRGPDGPNKGKEASKPSKAVMGPNSLFIIIPPRDSKQAFKNPEKVFKEAKNWI